MVYQGSLIFWHFRYYCPKLKNMFKVPPSPLALSYLRRKDGKKVLIGDNLSSHFSEAVIESCLQHNIKFVCLPPTSTHLCQPLDAAFFRPLKMKWQSILSTWETVVQFAMYQDIFSFRIFGDLENYTFLETLGPSESEKQCLHFFQASYGRHLGFSKWRLFFSEI